ncbi:hypothetical protein CBL_03609 [Carabus blaptoides fortunei]
MKAGSFKVNQKLFIDPAKLLPLQRFLPRPPGSVQKKRGAGGGRGGGGSRGRGGFGGSRGAVVVDLAAAVVDLAVAVVDLAAVEAEVVLAAAEAEEITVTEAVAVGDKFRGRKYIL